jgi:CRP/FNR family transcriptional regulator
MFYIEAGFVKAYVRNARGDQHLHMIYGPGEFFPLLYSERRARRGVTYEALINCQLLELNSGKLESALRTRRQLSFEMIELAAEQFASSLDRINSLQYRFARERLIDCLLYLAQRFGVASGAGYEIIVRISHQALASKVNLSRESVSREIDRLIRKGLIQVRDGRIILVDVPALQAQLPDVPDAAGLNRWGLPLSPDIENNPIL